MPCFKTRPTFSGISQRFCGFVRAREGWCPPPSPRAKHKACTPSHSGLWAQVSVPLLAFYLVAWYAPTDRSACPLYRKRGLCMVRLTLPRCRADGLQGAQRVHRAAGADVSRRTLVVDVTSAHISRLSASDVVTRALFSNLSQSSPASHSCAHPCEPQTPCEH